MKKNSTRPVTYGYCRVSTQRQRVERQSANILARYPDAIIISEKFTGTKLDRPAWTKLFNALRPGDRVVFDEVSRLARNAAEGVEAYEALYNRGVVIEFIKQPHCNSSVYKDTRLAPNTGDKDLDETLIRGLNDYIMRLAKKQIQIAFDAAQAEVDHLHARVSEGMKASGAGEKISEARTGNTYETRKSVDMKRRIRELSKDFDGTLTDTKAIEYLGIARNTYYKYKRQILAAEAGEQ